MSLSVVVYQVWRSSLSVQWKMEDPESSIVEQFVSLTTRYSVDNNVPTMKVIYHPHHEGGVFLNSIIL